jgi:hypothetical protein
MLKRPFLTVLLVAMVATTASCIFDPDPPGDVPPPPSQKFQNLTEKWHVLNNIELAYTKRNIQKYDQLLDENFTFFLSTGDVGNDLPAQWDRTVEITANTNLFVADPPGELPRCKDIEMDVQWEDSEGQPILAWIEITTPGGEKWYTTTVFYDFRFEVEPDMTYINNGGAKAQFTIRNAGTEDAPVWKLVEFRDLGDPE